MKAVAPGLLALLAGCATVQPPASPLDHPAEYRCRGDWQTPESRFVVEVALAEDGSLKNYHLTWLRHSTNYSLAGWVMQFDFEGPRLPLPDDDWGLLLTMNGFAPGNRTVRVDLLRGGQGGADSVTLSAPRVRANAWIVTHWRRDAVRAALAGAPELVVHIVDRRGRTRLTHRLPSAVLDDPIRAVAIHRAEIEAMAADYRNRCEFRPAGQDIVVT
jgi:hypothetical protein